MKLLRFFILVYFLLANITVFASDLINWEDSLSNGITYRQQGKIQFSIDALSLAKQTAKTDQNRKRAAGEWGVSLLQARRLDQAEASLQEAYTYFSSVERARYAIDLGNLAIIRKRQKVAQEFYKEAVQLATNDANVHAIAGLALARVATDADRPNTLKQLFQEIGQLVDLSSRARLYLDLGEQARSLGIPTLELAYQSLAQARQISASLKPVDLQLNAKVLDALAQLYEDQGRSEESQILTRQAIEQTRSLAAGTTGDLLITLEWRQGRLQKALHQDELALASFQRAVDQIELLKQDIPIEYEDGRSSFSSTLNPIYLGLIDLQLQQSDKQTKAQRDVTLHRILDTIELIKQSEMQDYLGDRCIVDTVKGGSKTVIPAGTAVLYPIIFADRIELLLESGTNITRFTTKISNTIVRETAKKFANDLRYGSKEYLSNSQQLYDWLLRPFESFTVEQHIESLVIVPDGALRLVAMGALHDGKKFAIEKYSLSTVTGLSMTNTNRPPAQGLGFLVAGVSEPGPVVDKLSKETVDQIFNSASENSNALRGLKKSRSMRAIRFIPLGATDNLKGDKASRFIPLGATDNLKGDKVSRSAMLREALSLPGVKQEIDAIHQIIPGTSMLNASFTAGEFRQEAESGSYRIIHIATHGVFGGSAETSYVLAYDDLLTLDSLQTMLKSEHFRKNPIELLSLSACETAEGDDRSPLGISGAAMKARAKSVLGTLWPVDDDAARKAMETFYLGIAKYHLTKAESLRRSQIELLHNDEFSHPLYWAPFVLIGNWL
jgi:CHAT domain-containing protein